MSSLAEALPAEIARVSTLRGQYEALRSQPGVLVEPAIFMMTQAIDAAIRASGGGGVLAMLRAYEDLRGFTE